MVGKGGLDGSNGGVVFGNDIFVLLYFLLNDVFELEILTYLPV
jgi:hypothetical protein